MAETITTINKAGKQIYVKQMPKDSNNIVVTNPVNTSDLITILINKGVLKSEDLTL